MRKLLLLRPEPGLSASANRARALGMEVLTCPLFQVEPVAWEAPDPHAYDALLLTSANAVRHGGPALQRLKPLPVHAVGAATAEAARNAGFRVETVGEGNVSNLLATLPAGLRLLHLAGREHRQSADSEMDRRIVYQAKSVERPPLPELTNLVVAIHSPRAGARLAELPTSHDRACIVAISQAAAETVGVGWERIEVAERPSDPSLLALAAMLCHTLPPR